MKRLLVIVLCSFLLGCVQNQTGGLIKSIDGGPVEKNLYKTAAPNKTILKIGDEFQYVGVREWRYSKDGYSMEKDFHVFVKIENLEVTHMVVVLEGKIRNGTFVSSFYDNGDVISKDVETLMGEKYFTALWVDKTSNNWAIPIEEKGYYPPAKVVCKSAGRRLGVNRDRLLMVFYAEELKEQCNGKYPDLSDWEKEDLLTEEQKLALLNIEKQTEESIVFRQ